MAVASELTPGEHEHSAAVELAAAWLATEKNPPQPIIPALRQRYGLSAVEACAAIREAQLRRARAI